MKNKYGGIRIKTISFIEPGAPGLHIFRKYPIPRLGAVLLATILKERGYEVRVFIEDIAEPDWSYIENSDVVCISTITSTANKAYALGKRLRNIGIPVVMGGAHATFLPDEALDHADFVIRGEGEQSLGELLECLETGTSGLGHISGLSYKDNEGRNIHNPSGEFIQNLDDLPIPDFSLVHGWNTNTPYPVSTSRGCPFACSFCSVINMFGRKYRFKSVEGSLSELRHASSVSQATKFIVDDNFAAHPERTKAILQGMIAEEIKTSWSAQVRVDVAKDEELLRLMAESGCYTLFIGFESINPRTLAAYNKKQNKQDIVSCIRSVQSHGIHIHGMFVFGADTDDVGTIRDTAAFATDLGIDTVQFMILTPLPGTTFYADMEKSGRLMHKDWSKYDSHHVVFTPLLLSHSILQTETFRAMGRFYTWKHIFRYLIRLEFQYAAIGLFGKTAVNKFLKSSDRYLADMTRRFKNPDCTEMREGDFSGK